MWQPDDDDRDQLWSPAMRKWMRGSRRRGKPVSMFDEGGRPGTGGAKLPAALKFNIASNSMYAPSVVA